MCISSTHSLFWQDLNHPSTNFLVSVQKPTTSEFLDDSCSGCLLQSCHLSVFEPSWKLETYDRQSAVLASSYLAVQFLLVRMTVSTDDRASIHAVYTDDVPPEPYHIRCWQHDQQLLSLASRSFCVALANHRLVAASTDNVGRTHRQVATPSQWTWTQVRETHDPPHDGSAYIFHRHTQQRCTYRRK